MAIGTSEGEYYADRFDYLTRSYQQQAEGEGAGREQVPLYRGGKDVTPKSPQPKPILPDESGPKSLHSNIDREHHVPLLASATMDDSGNMNGLAIDHRANLSPQDEELIHLHEATELPMMNDLVRSGMKPSDAYAEAHKWATARETAASKARWGDEGHEQYQQRIRDATKIAAQPSDRGVHPNAHTSVYELDKSEGMPFKVASEDNVIPFPAHKPLQVNPLEDAPGLHMAGVKLNPRASKTIKRPTDKEPANVNAPKEPEGAEALLKGFGEVRQSHMGEIHKFMTEHPQEFKYLRALYQQQGGEAWDQFQEMEGMARGRHYEPEGEYGIPEIQPTTVKRFDRIQDQEARSETPPTDKFSNFNLIAGFGLMGLGAAGAVGAKVMEHIDQRRKEREEEEKLEDKIMKRYGLHEYTKDKE